MVSVQCDGFQSRRTVLRATDGQTRSCSTGARRIGYDLMMRVHAVLLWFAVALGALFLCAEPAQSSGDHAGTRAGVHSHTHSHGGITHEHAHGRPARPSRETRAETAVEVAGHDGSGRDHHHHGESHDHHGLPRPVAALASSTSSGKAAAACPAAALPPLSVSTRCSNIRPARPPSATGPPHLPSLRTVVLLT